MSNEDVKKILIFTLGGIFIAIVGTITSVMLIYSGKPGSIFVGILCLCWIIALSEKKVKDGHNTNDQGSVVDIVSEGHYREPTNVKTPAPLMIIMNHLPCCDDWRLGEKPSCQIECMTHGKKYLEGELESIEYVVGGLYQ